jgi:aryl-alcohol dehydrogenase-like predicted oxidoreductase
MLYGHVPGVTKPISRLVQGTATVFNAANVEDCYEMLDLSMKHGINTYDTAHCYGKARSVVFGQWLKDRRAADEVVILAKGAHPYGRPRVTPEDIKSDLDDTFSWMQVDYVDLLILHRDDQAVPVGPIVEVLNELKAAGKIGAFGGSNWTHERIAAANRYAKENGLVPFAASSPNFSAVEMVEEPWADCLSISGPQGAAPRAWYAESDVALFPWSSLAAGFMSGSFRREDLVKFKEDPKSVPDCIRCYGSEVNFNRLDRIREIADSKGATVPQIGLAYVLSQPFNLFALISCLGRLQFESNCAALEIKLTPQETAYIDLEADSPG